jgi:circadian clock protein KaiB
MVEYEVILFVAGDSPSSSQAIENVKHVLDGLAHASASLDIVDVLLSPEKAMESRIFATPTLILVKPLPEKRVIGDFANKEMVLQQLDLT